MFGKRLRATRIERGYTQQKMADLLDVALRTYQNYEEGSRRPSFDNLIEIGDCLNTSIDYLMGRDYVFESLGVSVDVFRTNLQEYPK